MKRAAKAIILLLAIPLVLVISLYIVALNVQPPKFLLRSGSASSTSYISENNRYELSGEMTYFPGKLINPEVFKGDFSLDGYSRAVSSLKHDLDSHETITSLSDIQNEKSIVGDNYVATVFFFLKLPATASYGCWFPGLFCEYNIYIDGELCGSSSTFGSETPNYPTGSYVEFPYSESGNYSVMLQIISPTNYDSEVSDSILFGSAERVSRSVNNSKKTTVAVICFTIFSLIYFATQAISLRNDKTLLYFILFLSASLLNIFLSDTSVLLAVVPKMSYQIGLVLKGISSPLFHISLVALTYNMFRELFPKRIGTIVCCLQAITLLNTLCLNRYPALSVAADLAAILPFALCLYVFIIAYEAEERFSLSYGISILLFESGSVLLSMTKDLAIPAQYTYTFGLISLTIVQIIIISSKYSEQDKKELFYQDELTRKLEAMQASENAFLNAQMKPHFLYNTLNTIADCCVTDPAKAKSLINSLSDYLKLILSLDNMDDTVPLRRELELVEAYTAIEKERFPSINFYNDFPVRMPAIMMPPITIQPLIENAIKHGVRKSDRPGVVTLRIVDLPECVQFYVSDNGAGMNDEAIAKLFAVPKENKSIGIYNIDKRLKNQYHNGLNVESTPGLGTCVSFSIPKF